MQLPELVNSVLSRPHYDGPGNAIGRKLNGLGAIGCRVESSLDLETHDSVYFARIVTEHRHDHRNGIVSEPDDCLRAI